MNRQRITISLADQNFAQTASVGVFNVATHLTRGLAERSDVELTVLNNRAAQLDVPGARNLYFDRVTTHPARRILWDQFGLYRAARRTRPEWLCLPKGYLSFLAKPPHRTVAYVHDLIFDEFHRERIRGFPRFKSWYFRASTRAALRWAAAIVTNSEFTRGEILKAAQRWGYPPPSVRAIGIGFDPPLQTVPKSDQILVLVSRWPNKDTPRAVDFLSHWERQANYQGRIVCVGSLPEGVGLPAHWILRQRLPRTEFSSLLATSRALVYFTRSEGFGMPPVEAALHGAPPVFAAIPATLEAMLGLGFPFDRESREAFSAALTAALACPPDTVASWAQQLFARHNWPGVVDRFLKFLNSPSEAEGGH